MMKWIVTLSFLFFSQVSHAGSTFLISSYYQTSAYLTQRFLPFAVKRSSDGKNVDEVVSVTVSKPCYSMIDPHRSYVFHIFCSEAGNTSFTVQIRDKGILYSITLPAIHVKALAIVSSTPVGPSPNPKDPMASGKKLFVNNCARCHETPYPLPRNLTNTKIKSAFNSYDEMKSFRTMFTDAQLSDLVKFINEGL